MAVLSLNSLPLGFRFRPTDEELVHYYLRSKINGNNEDVSVIREIDVCKWEPWDLPDLSVIKTRDPEWFFFCPLDRKYPNGSRLNRATEAGYWKATGRDRKIKSGGNLIGMKKTLVFYTGRAPKGKRTIWVMHEYRTTEDDLDGTKPGQTAFVLLKLFKKQDENLEGSNCDDVTNSSPAVVKSSLEDGQSGLELPQVSPSQERQEEKHSGNAESFFADFSDRTTSCTQVLPECHSINSNVCDVEDLAPEVTGPEVDPQLEADLNLFYADPLMEPLDYKMFSPLHSQMQAELGPSCMLYPNSATLANNNGMQFQYGSNESDASISDFLDSVFKDSEEYICNVSVRSKNTTIASEMAVVHQLGSEYPSTWPHGETMSCNLQMETSHEGHLANPSVLQNGLGKHYGPLSGFAATQNANSFSNYQELSNPKDSNGYGDISGTGIRIRSRQPRSQPDSQNHVNHGNASRRIRLQRSLGGWSTQAEHNDHGKPIDKEVQEKAVSEVLKASIAEGGISQQKANPKSTKVVLSFQSSSISIVSKAPSSGRTTMLCYTTMLRVAVVAVVLMSICSWRLLKVGS